MTNAVPDNASQQGPLESWKEIAAYLQRDVSTAMRWEKSERLPVHRHQHQARSSVYAYPSELDAWRAARRPAAEAVTRPVWRRPLPSAAFAMVLLLALVSVGSGPRIGMTALAAEGIVTRQVWTGPDADPYGTPSPDGLYLSFTDWSTGDLAIRDLTTGQNRRLTNKKDGWENWHEYAESSVFSPDGKQVAFEWYNQQDYGELRIVNVDGSGGRVLYRTDNPYDVIEPADWSRDGRLILARHVAKKEAPAGVTRIVTVSVADGSLTVLKTLDRRRDWSELRFSPDGRYVVYEYPEKSAEDFDILVLGVSSGQVVPLVEHPARDRLMGWAPDGRSVLFLSDRTGSWAIWMVPVIDGRAQGRPTLVKRDVGPVSPIGFTRKGAFYYGAYDAGINIYTSTLSGGTPMLLVNQFLGSNLGPAWSPGGKQIAYARRSRSAISVVESALRLCIRTIETGEEREYSPDLVWFAMPLQWSPDGQSILVRGRSQEGRTGSYRIDLATGRVAPVLLEPRADIPFLARWSADGKAVYYVEQLIDESGRESQRLVRRDLATGRDETVSLPPEGTSFTRVVCPSPDGRNLALWVNRGEQGGLAVMPSTGGELRHLSGPWADVRAHSLTWTPDSRQILFVRQEGKITRATRSELWGIPVDGGEPARLGFSTKGRLDLFSIHPDGKQLALSFSEPTNEVWVMENFLPGPGAGSRPNEGH